MIPLQKEGANCSFLDVKNGLQISSQSATGRIDPDVKKFKAEPFKQIILTCGASLYNHSNNVTWAKGNITTDIDGKNIKKFCF